MNCLRLNLQWVLAFLSKLLLARPRMEGAKGNVSCACLPKRMFVFLRGFVWLFFPVEYSCISLVNLLRLTDGPPVNT